MEPTQSPVPPQQPPGQPHHTPIDDEPYALPDTPSPTAPSKYSPTDSGTGLSRNKVFLAVCAVAAIELVFIIALMIALAGSPPKTKQNTNKTAGGSYTTTQSQDPQPATAIGVQRTNDSISQDIGNLNDDHDLPANKFDNRALGL